MQTSWGSWQFYCVMVSLYFMIFDLVIFQKNVCRDYVRLEDSWRQVCKLLKWLGLPETVCMPVGLLSDLKLLVPMLGRPKKAEQRQMGLFL